MIIICQVVKKREARKRGREEKTLRRVSYVRRFTSLTPYGVKKRVFSAKAKRLFFL